MADNITKRQGCWIQYQLALHGYTQNRLAEVANRSSRTVSHFLNGRKGSETIKTALCQVLGYEDFDLLLDEIPQEPGTKTRRGGAA